MALSDTGLDSRLIKGKQGIPLALQVSGNHVFIGALVERHLAHGSTDSAGANRKDSYGCSDEE
jgi:hypothetical protein